MEWEHVFVTLQCRLHCTLLSQAVAPTLFMLGVAERLFRLALTKAAAGNKMADYDDN